MFIYLDLTERQQADREVAEARERAEAATRAKSAFLATMSHEIRTPMNGVLGMAELLLHEDLAPAQREMVDTIHRSGAHLLGVLNDILDFSKVGGLSSPSRPSPFDPTRATRDVVALLRAAAEAKGLALLFRAEPGTPAAVQGDPGRVRQVLTNFIGNAIKFTREGTIWVTLGPAGAGGGLRLAVRDTGIGIPADRLDAVFESFAQAHTSTAREYGGTGLGLAICRQLAELMGGRVGVESAPGEGSTFWCELPLPTYIGAEPAAAPPAPVRPAAPPPATGAGTRVLLADDTSVNLAVATRMLKKLGCRVDTAVDGAEALAKARAGGYDLVLLDCNMPVLDGFGAARAIRALAGEMAQVPIVALTASVTAEEHRLCREAGMDAVLAKPVTIEQLRELLAERTAPAAPAG
ncbi:MAG: response regulator [Gemmatimonadetes bacterium]|nr:response regulator [Gemmatimonadota bacterium]